MTNVIFRNPLFIPSEACGIRKHNPGMMMYMCVCDIRATQLICYLHDCVPFNIVEMCQNYIDGLVQYCSNSIAITLE